MRKTWLQREIPISSLISKSKDFRIFKTFLLCISKYIFFSCRSSYECSGSKALCEYLMDYNNTLMEASMKNPIMFNISKQAEILAKNIIIVHMKFPSSKVDMTILESRYALSDQIANIGGIFGVWVELTGFSFLGIINVFLIVLKVMLGILKRWVFQLE